MLTSRMELYWGTGLLFVLLSTLIDAGNVGLRRGGSIKITIPASNRLWFDNCPDNQCQFTLEITDAERIPLGDEIRLGLFSFSAARIHRWTLREFLELNGVPLVDGSHTVSLKFPGFPYKRDDSNGDTGERSKDGFYYLAVYENFDWLREIYAQSPFFTILQLGSAPEGSRFRDIKAQALADGSLVVKFAPETRLSSSEQFRLLFRDGYNYEPLGERIVQGGQAGNDPTNLEEHHAFVMSPQMKEALQRGTLFLDVYRKRWPFRTWTDQFRARVY